MHPPSRSGFHDRGGPGCSLNLWAIVCRRWLFSAFPQISLRAMMSGPFGETEEGASCTR